MASLNDLIETFPSINSEKVGTVLYGTSIVLQIAIILRISSLVADGIIIISSIGILNAVNLSIVDLK